MNGNLYNFLSGQTGTTNRDRAMSRLLASQPITPTVMRSWRYRDGQYNRNGIEREPCGGGYRIIRKRIGDNE